MNYAKLTDGYPHYAPPSIHLDGMTVANPGPEQLRAVGYLPVILTDAPETDKQHYAVQHWEQTADSIKQVWEIKEIEPVSPTEEERIVSLENWRDDIEKSYQKGVNEA